MLQTNIEKKNQNAEFLFNKFFFENRNVFEIMSDNIVQPDSTQMTV